jgi:hypothetical protein
MNSRLNALIFLASITVANGAYLRASTAARLICNHEVEGWNPASLGSDNLRR